MRLRQVVVVARDLETVVAQLRAALPLGEPFADPGVGLFGLRNAVMALGDTFVEVISPVREGTAAGRHLERHGGDSGYMVMVEVGDLAAARARADELGVRVVWEAALEDIVAMHLHPKDTGGTLLSLDEPRPAGSWRWAGPAWEGRIPRTGREHVAAATIAVADPEAVAERWSALLGRPREATAIALDRGQLRFVRGEAGLCEVTLSGLHADATVAGVRFRGAA